MQEKLQSLYTKGKFDAEFVQAAKDELPYTWGRQSLLEEFYALNAPGLSERSRRVSEQLGQTWYRKPGLLGRLIRIFGF